MRTTPFRTAPPATPPTREALLHAAGEVFAEVGFQAATVRAICRRAGANVAAVNYHFGDKERLYLEVLRHAQTETSRRLPFDLGVPARATPEQRLRAFVRSLLTRLLEPGPHAWLGKLMSREMLEPTHGLDQMVREHIRPMADQLRAIVRAFLGPDRDEQTVRLYGFSIVSQCLFYHHCRSVICRLFPDLRVAPEIIEPLTDHITRCSLAALKDVARPRSPASRPRSPSPRHRNGRTRATPPRSPARQHSVKPS
jgi:AcrR family transcriptional regulator